MAIKILVIVFILAGVSITASAQGYKWGPWNTDPCFSGLQFRARYDSYNDSAKKHHWYIQYKNNYGRKIAFSYRLGGTRDEVAQGVKENGPQYRTEIKPGETDSGGMWALTSSQSQILEVAGHARLLDPDEIDINKSFMNCDSGGNRGQIDYICRNQPKPYVYCSNYVPPPPAALAAASKRGVGNPAIKGDVALDAPASPSECLELYQYFSQHRKSDDRIAVKQAIDAADVFKARCKLTPEQKVEFDQTLNSTGKRLELVGSDRSQRQSSDASLLNEITVSKNDDFNELKQQFVDGLNQSLGSTWGAGYKVNFYNDQGRLKLKLMMAANASDPAIYMDVKKATEEGIAYPDLGFGFVDTNSTWTAGLLLYFKKDGGRLAQVYVSKENTGPAEPQFAARSQALNAILEKINNGESSKPDLDIQKVEPSSVADYEAKIVTEAKAKGIKVQPNYPREIPKPPPVLNARQRLAQEAAARDQFSVLFERDIAVKKEEDERLAILRAAEEKKRIDAERAANLRAESERIALEEKRKREDALRKAKEAKNARWALYKEKESRLNERIENMSVFSFAQFPGPDWYFEKTLFTTSNSYSYTYEHKKRSGTIYVRVMWNELNRSFEEQILEATPKMNDWKREGQSFQHGGFGSGYVVTSTSMSTSNIAKTYFFQDSDGFVYQVKMSGYGGPGKWIRSFGDDLARSFRVK